MSFIVSIIEPHSLIEHLFSLLTVYTLHIAHHLYTLNSWNLLQLSNVQIGLFIYGNLFLCEAKTKKMKDGIERIRMHKDGISSRILFCF